MRLLFILVLVIVIILPCVVQATGTDGVSFSIPTSYVSENVGNAAVSVVRTGGVESCSVGYMTVSDTAFPGRDYGQATGQVDFAAGQTVAGINASIISNSVPEPTRLFRVVLQGFLNCVPGAVTTQSVAIGDAQTMETMPQDFESGLPSGWGVSTNAHTNGYWRFDSLAKGNWGNTTGGRGNYAIADNCNYIEPMDTELRLASFPVAVTALTYLVFKTDYLAGGSDVADVDVSGSGEAGPWTNLWRKQMLDYPGPVTVILDLPPEVRGRSNVVVRFHYYNATNEWYWQIDDVAILVEPDSNTNGLPDWWETAFYSGLTNLSPRGDSDGDGVCDGDEFIAGTNPRETQSNFRVDGLTQSNTNMILEFPTEVAHYYDLRYSSNLMDQGGWQEIEKIQGMGGWTNFVLDLPGPIGFYQLTVSRW